MLKSVAHNPIGDFKNLICIFEKSVKGTIDLKKFSLDE